MTRVLITGGAGALGSSLAKMLVEKEYEVDVVEIIPRHSAHRLKDVDVQYFWKSCEDLTAKDLDGVDIICHCCAQPDRPLGVSSPLYTIHKNTMELAAVLEACRKSEIKKFLYPGSGTIFLGVSPDKQPITEETTPKPTNPYSATKYMDEILCDAYRICYGVPTVILRSGLVYGEGMRLDISIAQFIIKALKGERIAVKSPGATRTPTHGEDVLKYWKAVIELAPEEVVGEIFHSVRGKEYSIKEIAEAVVGTLGSNSEIEELPYELGELVGGKPVRQWTVSTKDQKLGVKPKIDLPEGIRRTAKWIEDEVLRRIS